MKRGITNAALVILCEFKRNGARLIQSTKRLVKCVGNGCRFAACQQMKSNRTLLQNLN